MSESLPIVDAAAQNSPETSLDEPRWSIPLGIFGRTPPFTRRQRRVFFIATTAGFFDQYDRALLTLALKQIQKGLQISEQALGNLLTLIRLGYIGSLLITPLADVFGRRRLLLYTIVAYTIFTGLAAIAPSAHFFVACEMLARVFAGAEGTVALVILSEEVDAGVRGWAIGLLSALTSVGFGIAATASTAPRCSRIQLSASGAVSVRNWGMSSPAEKISWPPKTMTAAMSSRRLTSAAAPSISR